MINYGRAKKCDFKHCLTTNEAVVRKLVGRPIVRLVLVNNQSLVIADSKSVLVSGGIVLDMIENVSQ